MGRNEYGGRRREMITKVKNLLKDHAVDIFIGYKMTDGHPLPHCFVKDRLDEIDDLVAGTERYPLEKIATRITAEDPHIKIGILTRDCNQRALVVLYNHDQLNSENIKTVNLNCCPSNIKAHGDCSYLEPEEPGYAKKKMGWDNNMDTDAIEKFDQEERFSRWAYEFQKCIKCYGCRNICPVCFCKECSLENDDLVGSGPLPPEVPIFHLIRAVHMAGRCIDCGLCEDACPADIPLRLLYRKVNDIVKNVFDYTADTRSEQSPFSILGDTVLLKPKEMAAI
jgi:ferredoxin